jgi:hypothetical protein
MAAAALGRGAVAVAFLSEREEDLAANKPERTRN